MFHVPETFGLNPKTPQMIDMINITSVLSPRFLIGGGGKSLLTLLTLLTVPLVGIKKHIKKSLVESSNKTKLLTFPQWESNNEKLLTLRLWEAQKIAKLLGNFKIQNYKHFPTGNQKSNN